MAIRISTLGVRGWVKYYLDDCYGEVVIVDVWYKVSDICFAVVGTLHKNLISEVVRDIEPVPRMKEKGTISSGNRLYNGS